MFQQGSGQEKQVSFFVNGMLKERGIKTSSSWCDSWKTLFSKTENKSLTAVSERKSKSACFQKWIDTHISIYMWGCMSLLCLFVTLSLTLSVSRPVVLSVYLSVWQLFYVLVKLSLGRYDCLSRCLTVFLSAYLSHCKPIVRLPNCLCGFLSPWLIH